MYSNSKYLSYQILKSKVFTIAFAGIHLVELKTPDEDQYNDLDTDCDPKSSNDLFSLKSTSVEVWYPSRQGS